MHTPSDCLTAISKSEEVSSSHAAGIDLKLLFEPVCCASADREPKDSVTAMIATTAIEVVFMGFKLVSVKIGKKCTQKQKTITPGEKCQTS
jgi:hypothetical protein